MVNYRICNNAGAANHQERPLNITLEPVTIDNFEDIIEMELPPDQAGFVATNAQSVAQAHYYPDPSWPPR